MIKAYPKVDFEALNLKLNVLLLYCLSYQSFIAVRLTGCLLLKFIESAYLSGLVVLANDDKHLKRHGDLSRLLKVQNQIFVRQH